MILIDFKKDSKVEDWLVIDDDVMGGISNGEFKISESGNGLFLGNVSLANNGGFSSVRFSLTSKNIEGFTEILLALKGDGKRYQFRVKVDRTHSHSYIYVFKTSGDWEIISIPLHEMKPYFRGSHLDKANFSGKQIEEFSILISNKKAEQYRLEIEKISLK